MRIYLDHNATTPVRDEVAEAMLRVLRDCPGNPSSVHAEGAAARAEVERARERVAALLGARPAEIVFTGSATEANNAALRGRLSAPGARVVTTRVEHPSVSEPLEDLEGRGVRIDRVAVDASGRVDAAAFAEALAEPCALVSAIWANNETGVLQPVEEIAALARKRGVACHLDATQVVGKLPVDLEHLAVDLLALSAHKFGGPKGVGALVVRGEPLPPLLCGGPQERRRRGGTENVAGIAGMGVAAELARVELEDRVREWGRLRDRLWEGLLAKVPGVRRNGSAEHVLPNTLNVEFEGTPGDVLVEALDLEGVAVSAGAACASGSIEPSPVLLAMGRSPEQARASLRLSVGHGVGDAEIDHVLSLLPDLVERVRQAEREGPSSSGGGGRQ